MLKQKHHNPLGLHQDPAFTQAVEVPADASLVFIGGQNGIDGSGAVVGDSPYEQTTKALENVKTAVEAAGGSAADIAKWTILVTDREHLNSGFAAFAEFWDQAIPPPAITVQIVSGLADASFLVEIEAIAAIQP